MKKNKCLEILLTFLWAEFALLSFRKQLSPILDGLFLKIIGKTFSQRSDIIQIMILTAASAAITFCVWKIISYHRTNAAVTIGSLVFLSFLIAVICAMQTIRRDDYWEIHDAGFYGFPGFIVYEYVKINGRYFSLFLRSLYQFVNPTVYINTLLLINIVLLWGGLIHLMKILDKSFPRLIRLAGGMCIALGILFMSPNIWEVWFWGSGTVVYGVGITMAVWAAVLMIDIAVTRNRTGLKTAAAAFFIFCACGTSELITASVCFFSFMILILPKILWHRKWNREIAFLTLFSWLITIVILTTSGDIRDAAGLSGHRYENLTALALQIPEKILMTVNTIISFFGSRIEYAAVFSVLAFLLGLCCSAGITGKALAAGVIVLVPAAVGALLINALIDFMPARVISIALDWVFLAVALIMFWIGSLARRKIFPGISSGVVAGLISLTLLTVIGSFYISNIGRIRDIRTAWLERDRELSAMNGSDDPVKTCAIPVMGSGRADPSDDPSADFNIVTAYYYGFPSITADHLCPPFEP